jgi:hypothetical protein
MSIQDYAKSTHQGLQASIGVRKALAEERADSAKDVMQLLIQQQR